MAKEKMLTIDTTMSGRTMHIKIDGIVYEMRPLNSHDLLVLMDHQDELNAATTGKLSAELLGKLEQVIYPLVNGLMSPNDRFEAWCEDCKARNELAYMQVMNTLARKMAENMRIVSTLA